MRCRCCLIVIVGLVLAIEKVRMLSFYFAGLCAAVKWESCFDCGGVENNNWKLLKKRVLMRDGGQGVVLGTEFWMADPTTSS